MQVKLLWGRMTGRSSCPISGVLDIVGDKWTLLILRDMMFGGKSRYLEFQRSPEGIATNILSARLSMLEDFGLVRKTPDPADGRRQIYLLTERGISLAPILVEMTLWGESNLPDVHKINGLQDRLKAGRDDALGELAEQLRRKAGLSD